MQSRDLYKHVIIFQWSAPSVPFSMHASPGTCSPAHMKCIVQKHMYRVTRISGGFMDLHSDSTNRASVASPNKTNNFIAWKLNHNFAIRCRSMNWHNMLRVTSDHWLIGWWYRSMNVCLDTCHWGCSSSFYFLFVLFFLYSYRPLKIYLILYLKWSDSSLDPTQVRLWELRVGCPFFP